jgi:protein-export membrane protein SecD
MKNKKLRSLIILVVVVGILYYIAPLLIKDLPDFWTSKRLKLGLDLQGGSQIMLQVDYEDLKLSEAEKKEVVSTALQIIRNRIDQFGVSEPSIQPVGDNRIMIQLPGLTDPSRAKELIGKTALLEFKLVADPEQYETVFENLNLYFKDNYEKYPFLEELGLIDKEAEIDVLQDSLDTEDEEFIASDIFTQLVTSLDGSPKIPYKHLEYVRKLMKSEEFLNQIPAGLQFAIGKEDKLDKFAARDYYVLKARTEMSGSDLEKSFVRIGQGMDPRTSGKPYVALTLNRGGAKKFETVTGQNVKKRLAIVLDDIVYVAPQIEDKIRGGEAQITGSFTIEEVQDLVIVLNAGNLPAPVNVIEERTVGPTLGSDSIRAGTSAAMYGFIIVILFMIVYYGLSGLIADIAVLINVGFILSALTMLNATLTMPGIAGMILTIGMAVDANVLIFERIREELKAGKTVRTAVDSGFDRAIVTILDANITTLITAVVLYQFGTGPIKGFAVTLSFGIIGSMFAAIVLSKAIFDGFITNVNRKKLSI